MWRNLIIEPKGIEICTHIITGDFENLIIEPKGIEIQDT